MDPTNLLGLLGAQTAGLAGMPQVPDVASQLPSFAPIQAALANNALQPHPQDQAQPQPQQGHGLFHQGGTISNILGALGDAFLVQSGHQPVYAPMMAEKRRNEALKNYLGNLSPDLAGLIGGGMDASDAIAAYKLVHPEAGNAPDIVREMQAAGIDPTSEEGKTMIRHHIGGGGASEPNFVRELQAMGIDPHSHQALELYYGRNSPAGYLLKPPADGGGSESLPTVNSQEEYNALPPGSPYRDSQGNVGLKRGGATASTPSSTFPAR